MEPNTPHPGGPLFATLRYRAAKTAAARAGGSAAPPAHRGPAGMGAGFSLGDLRIQPQARPAGRLAVNTDTHLERQADHVAR